MSIKILSRIMSCEKDHTVSLRTLKTLSSWSAEGLPEFWGSDWFDWWLTLELSANKIMCFSNSERAAGLGYKIAFLKKRNISSTCFHQQWITTESYLLNSLFGCDHRIMSSCVRFCGNLWIESSMAWRDLSVSNRNSDRGSLSNDIDAAVLAGKI
jgi:hypothetical protein